MIAVNTSQTISFLEPTFITHSVRLGIRAVICSLVSLMLRPVFADSRRQVTRHPRSQSEQSRVSKAQTATKGLPS